MKKCAVLLVALLLVVVVCLVICYLAWPPMLQRIHTETARVRSPDSKSEVVVMESDVGAASAAMHHIYIMPVGKKVSRKDVAVLYGTWLYELQVKWISDSVLEISYGQRETKDRILKTVQSINVAGQTYSVKITPHPPFKPLPGE